MKTYEDLDKEAYEKLYKETRKKPLDNWYEETYKLFKDPKLNLTNREDFLILVSLAYSWMPTIPNYIEQNNWEKASKYLDKLPDRNGCNNTSRAFLMMP